jgi:drug/metabolite transporter (DMT)-like permease
MDAVLLALLSAALFGAMTVAVRVGFSRFGNAALGSLTMTAVAFAVCAVGAAVAPGRGEVSISALWPFALAGLLAPGLSQFLFTRAVAEAGPSRASVVVGMAPLVSVVIALAALREPIEAVLIAGAILIVLGGIALASERVRPEHFRLVGLVLAFGSTMLFSIRDNLVRWLSGDTEVSPLVACSVTLLAGTGLMLVLVLADRRPARLRELARAAGAFAAAGVFFGLSYAALFEAYYRGRVTVVSPLVATESLWGVTLSALVIGRSELIGRRLVAGAVLIVAGGALIGAAS